MCRRATFSILLIVLLTLVACGGGAKTEPVTAPTAAKTEPTAVPAQAEVKPTATAQPPATQTPKPVAATATAAPVEEALPILKSGALKSYAAKIEIKSEVVKPEAALESWTEAEMTYRLEPAPTALSMVMKDKTEQGRADILAIVIGEVMYFKAPGAEQWMKLPNAGAGLSEMAQAMLDPEQLAKDTPVDVFTAANVVNRNEMVEGVATVHYRATEAQLRALMETPQFESVSQRKLLSGSADFWVAKQGNYLKQYRTETLQEDEAGRQIKTTMQLLVTQENEPVTIEPPPADQVTEMPAFNNETPEPEPTAEAAPVDISAKLAVLPAPPQSEEYQPSELPGGLRFIVETMAAQAPVRAFLSDASPEEVDQFYETELPKLGYQPVMQMAGEMGIAINMFKKGDQSVMIRINQDPDTGKTLVTMQIP